MGTKFPGHFETSVWLMPDGFLVERRCIVGRHWPTYEIRSLASTVDDSVLGAEVVDASRSRPPRTWEELDPALKRLQKDFPGNEKWADLHHSILVVFDPAESADSLKLDGRAAKINEPTLARIPADSSDAAVGAAIRKMFDKLGPMPPARTAKKKAGPRRSRDS